MRNFLKQWVGAVLVLAVIGCKSEEAKPVAAVNTPSPVSTPTGVPQNIDRESYRPEIKSGDTMTLVAKMEPLEGPDLSSVKQTDEILELSNFHVATEKSDYDSSLFEPLMPEKAVKVGEVWKIPSQSMKPFLSQFHGSVTESMNMDGSGSFGVLRGVSEDYFDLRFRTHAQFELSPRVYMSPGQFAGRAIVNRKSQALEYFSLEVPTTNKLNVNFEILKDEFAVGMVYTPEFKIQGGKLPENIAWTSELEETVCNRTLKSEFFAFEKLEWLPLEQAIKKSEESKKPVFSIVIAGVLDDESC